jgi:hypothetical protein
MADWIKVDGKWLHRPWWKVAINTVLRLVQPGRWKFVIFTRSTRTDPPRAIGYGFGRVEHLEKK